MDHTLTASNNSSFATLIDQDIAHIRRVMLPSLHGDLAGPILPPHYWRDRLNRLLDASHLSHAQLRNVDSLLLQLDEFDTQHALPIWTALPLAAHESHGAVR
jgi:hypothetical protein